MKQVETYPCLHCGGLHTQEEMHNHFFCNKCHSKLENCPTCDSKNSVYFASEKYRCVSCGDEFHEQLFSKSVVYHKSWVEKLCDCGKIMEFEHFEIQNFEPTMELKCSGCQKSEYITLTTKN